MNIIERIKKEVKSILELTKTTLSQNIIQARQTKSLQLTEQQIGALIKIIEVSVDEAYQKSVKSLQTGMSKYFDIDKRKK